MMCSDKQELQNVFAVLAHEKPDSVEDLVFNLRFCDPSSIIILYDASPDKIISHYRVWEKIGVELVAAARPLLWGELLDFAIGSIEHMASRDFDVITFVDSDQLMLRKGYSSFLKRYVIEPFGVLSIHPHRHGVDSNILAVRDLHAEWAIWKPYLERYKNWKEAFVRWTFWPGTVVSADAARDIARELKSPALRDLLSHSKAWATEECIIPTVSYLLGYKEVLNPCNRHWCRFRTPWSEQDLEVAMQSEGAFFIHPVSRSYNDPIRTLIRNRLTSS